MTADERSDSWGFERTKMNTQAQRKWSREDRQQADGFDASMRPKDTDDFVVSLSQPEKQRQLFRIVLYLLYRTRAPPVLTTPAGMTPTRTT